MRYSTDGQQTDHPLRGIRMLADEALRSMSMQVEPVFDDGSAVDSAGAVAARIAVPGAVQGLQRTASDGGAGLQPAVPVFRRVEQGDPAWDRTTFGENRDRLPAGETAASIFDAISCQARAAGLPSDEYFTVDGHSLGACERQCDDTHQATNDGDRRGQRQAGRARSAGRVVVPLPAGYRPCSA